jgi:hypothetical protein
MTTLTRRTFVKLLPVAGAATLSASALPSKRAEQGPAPSPTPSPSPTPQKPSPLAEAYAEVARVRFGDKLTPQELEQVKKDLDNGVRNADRLRSAKLHNDDEPDFIFSV